MAVPPGQRRDLTTGPIARTLLLFALPTLGANILQSLNSSINAIWVGRFLGEEALAATSNATIIMFLMFGAVFGFGLAATILIGQSIGRRDIDGARRVFGTAVGLVLPASIAVALAGWAFTPDILRLLATPGPAMALADDYLRVIFLGVPASMLLVLLTSALRGSGDSVTPLWFTAIAVVFDAGLNPVFILGLGPAPRMGIAGSAAATLIANHLAVIGLFLFIYARDLPLRLRGPEWRYLLPSRMLMRQIVGKGVPIGAQMLVISGAGLAMIGLVNRLGVDTAAAYGVSQQLWTYIQMPALAIGAGVSAMAAQNIGAGRWDRVDRIARSGIAINVLLTGATVAAVILFDREVMTLFLPATSPALPIARHIQLIASWNFILFGMTMVLFSTVRANGAVLAPLLILTIAFFPVRLGLAFGLRGLLGADALWWSFPIGSAASFAMALAYYRLGRWREATIAPPRAGHEARGHLNANEEPAGMDRPAV
jgi:putative MATE family efflux protein